MGKIRDFRRLCEAFEACEKDSETRVARLKELFDRIDPRWHFAWTQQMVTAYILSGAVDHAVALGEAFLESGDDLPESFLHLAARYPREGVFDPIVDRLARKGIELADGDNRGPSARAYWIRQGWALIVVAKRERGEDFREEKELLTFDEDWRICENGYVEEALKARARRKKRGSGVG